MLSILRTPRHGAIAAMCASRDFYDAHIPPFE